MSDEPYWSAEDWETWAIGMFNDVPESRKFLPSWINKVMK